MRQKKLEKKVIKKRGVGRPPQRGDERGVQVSINFPRTFLKDFLERLKSDGKNKSDFFYACATKYMASTPRLPQR